MAAQWACYLNKRHARGHDLWCSRPLERKIARDVWSLVITFAAEDNCGVAWRQFVRHSAVLFARLDDALASETLASV